MVRAYALCLGVRRVDAEAGDLLDGGLDLLHGGAEARFDVVVLADGGWSSLRWRVSADRPRYSGVCLYRGLAPLEALGGAADNTFFLWGHGTRRFDGYAVGGAFFNWGCMVPEPEPDRAEAAAGSPPHAHPSRHSPAVDAAVDAAAAAFPNDWPARVAAATRGSGRAVARHPLYHLACDRVAEGRIAVLGDAAHLASPLTGSGLRTAMLDAIALKDCFLRVGAADVPAALAAYDAATRDHRFDFALRSTQALDMLQSGTRFRLPLARPLKGALRDWGRSDAVAPRDGDDAPDVDVEPTGETSSDEDA